MRKTQIKSLGITVYLSYMLAYALPLLLLAITMFYVDRADNLRHFLPSFDKDVDFIKVLTIDKNFSQWNTGLSNLIESPNQPTIKRFADADKAWEGLLYDLNADAHQPEWLAALQTSNKSRQAVLQLVDQLQQSTELLEDAVEKDLVPASNEIVAQMDDIKGALFTRERDAADLVAQITRKYQEAILSVVRFIQSNDTNYADAARQVFLSIEDSFGQIDTNRNAAVEAKIGALRESLSAFYGKFENISGMQQQKAKAIETLKGLSMQETIKKVNPLAGGDWQKNMQKLNAGTFERIFSTIQYLLLIGIIILGVGMVYSLIHVHVNFQKPIEALISYASHAYITRKRIPVPGMERKDEIGALARAIQAMLERMQSAQTVENSESGETAVTVDNGGSDEERSLATYNLHDPQHLAALTRAYRRTEEFLVIADRIDTFATGATERSSEGADLADQTRRFMQDASNIMQELLRLVENMHQTIEHEATLAGELDILSVRSEIGSRNTQLAVLRLYDSIRAMRSLIDEVGLLSQNARLTVYHNDFTPQAFHKLVEQISLLSQHFTEASTLIDQQSAEVRKTAEDQARSADALSTSVRQNVMLAGTLITKSRESRDYVHEHVAQVQNAAFQAGRLAILMLDISAEVMQSGTNAGKVKTMAQEVLSMLDDMKKQASERLSGKSLPGN